MGGGHSCETSLTTADAQLAALEAQLKSLSTSSTCAINLANEKNNLALINRQST